MKVIVYPMDVNNNVIPLPIGKFYGVRTSVNVTGFYISGKTGQSFQVSYNTNLYSPSYGPINVEPGDMLKFNPTGPATATIFYD